MRWLARLAEWTTRNKIGRADDPDLGPLILNDGGTDGCWVARVTAHDRPICFEIGGRYEPGPALIERARDIFQSFERFASDVKAFLDREAMRDEWAPLAAEIRALVIRDVCLFWPNDPTMT
jgi:hypothetical protein